MPPREQSPQHNSRLVETAKFIGEVTAAVAKKVGGDILRVCGLSRREKRAPRTMTDAEVREWNVQNGFPEDWRL